MRNKRQKTRYSGLDTQPWKVVTHEGVTITVLRKDGTSKTLNGYRKYRLALRLARFYGGVAVRE